MISTEVFAQNLREMRRHMLGADVDIEDDFSRELVVEDSRGRKQEFPYQVCRWRTGEGRTAMRYAVLLKPILKQRTISWGWPTSPFTVWEMDAQAMYRELRGYVEGTDKASAAAKLT